jgi:putative membrane protein
MDEMMGGEGSEQLDSTHRWMGYQYLQNNGNLGGFGPGMMSGWGYGGGTWGPGMMSGWYGPARMGSQFVAWIWIAGFLLISVAIVLVIVLKQRRRRIENSPVNALEILRARYAKGEISREEFQKIREGLQ